VVETEQMQDAVRAEQFELVLNRMPGHAGLLLGDSWAQHDVAEHPRVVRLVDVAVVTARA
jgi:hypothetical protein